MDLNKMNKGKEQESMAHGMGGSQSIAQAMPGDMLADHIAMEDLVASGQGQDTEDTVMPGQKKAIDDTAASIQGKAVDDKKVPGQGKASDDTAASGREQAADTGTSDQEQKDPSEESKQGYSKGDDLLNQYKKSRKAVESAAGGDSVSQIELLRQELQNWGMKFAGSTIQNSTFVVNNVGHKEYQGEDAKKNLLGEAAEGELLDWCSQHYQDLHFSMLLAVCILDRQPYQTIYQMAKELQRIFAASTEKQDEEKIGSEGKSRRKRTAARNRNVPME